MKRPALTIPIKGIAPIVIPTKALFTALLSVLLVACGGGGSNIGSDSGIEIAQLEANPFNASNESSTLSAYLGDAPRNADVQAFKSQFWDQLRADNRCGACHGSEGSRANQPPTFVRTDDVNLAYEQALTVISTENPSESLLVSKVAGGHNCWLASAAACEDILITYIQNWTGGVSSNSVSIDLTAPAIRDAGASKNFPSDATVFTDLHDLLDQYCASCHSDTAAVPISPYFASGDLDAAYVAAQNKIDLETPANSRFVVRLSSEFHNCWSNCSDNASEMLAAVTAMADAIPETSVDPALVLSKAMRLTDGIVISGGGRYDDSVIAMYQFKTGSGNVVYDTSGVEPALNLTLDGLEGVDYEWIGGWGVQMSNSKAQGLTSDSRKLHQRLLTSGEYSIEAWVAPANVTQEGPAIIVGYSAGNNARNFSLGQTLYNYNFLNRSSTTDGNGTPALSTPDANEELQATLQHVVATYDAVDGRKLYVNGELIEIDQNDGGSAELGGNLADWDDTFAFVLGNETGGDRLWQGAFRLVAIHEAALTADQVRSNFDVGIGERFYLLFNVADIIDVPESYVVFEVSQFDNYSYLFNEPFFINLDSANNSALSNIPVAGLRIGINGREAAAGQAYQNISTSINASNFDSDGKQALSTLGTIIGLEKGPQNDDFFLTFERLGSETNVVVEAIPQPIAATLNLDPEPDIGLRTFDEINSSMAAMTGVATTESAVNTTFSQIRQQLPTVENIEGFLSAHQMAVTQLAIAYCNAMVEDVSLRRELFPDSIFSTNAGSIADADWDSQVISPIISRFVGDNISSQPDTSDVEAELQRLIYASGGLADCSGSCSSDRSATIVKAACAAAMGSAAMLIQ